MNGLKLPLSLADRWVNCPGSAQLERDAGFINASHDESREQGKAADWVAEQIIRAMQGDSTTLISDDIIGTLAPNNIVIDREMYEAVREYTNDIFRACNEHGLLRNVEIQREVDTSWYHDGQKAVIDSVVVDHTNKRVIIWDLKFGRTIVEVFECWQLIGYAISIESELDIEHDDDQWMFDLRIVQPRGYHRDGIVRRWVVSLDTLNDYATTIANAAHTARAVNAPCKPSVNTCNKCTGRHKCEALTRSCYAMIDYCHTPQPLDMSPSAQSVELRLLRAGQKLIKSRMDGLESAMLADVKAGTNMPGFMLDETRPREKWQKSVELDEVLLMAEMMGVDAMKPREIDTPAQLRQKGVDATVISEYSFRPKGKLILVEDDGAKARQVFGK